MEILKILSFSTIRSFVRKGNGGGVVPKASGFTQGPISIY